MNIVILGLSLSSSWGNGHATTYRALVRALAGRGHSVIFLERDCEWYASHRDCADPDYCDLVIYQTSTELRADHLETIRNADAVIVGSYVPDGVELGTWVTEEAEGVTAFYDIDTPVTLAAVEAGECSYITSELIPEYDVYLSFAGGRILETLEEAFNARCARALYCAVDETIYYPVSQPLMWDLGYLGTFASDRQATVAELLERPAQVLPQSRFVIAGPGFPLSSSPNIERIEHLGPDGHRAFYNAQRFTLNATRRMMVNSGYSPSVRIFEAAACGVPIISDVWEGIEAFLEPGREIFLARSTDDVCTILQNTPEEVRLKVASAARERILRSHTAAHRALELETILSEVGSKNLLEAL